MGKAPVETLFEPGGKIDNRTAGRGAPVLGPPFEDAVELVEEQLARTTAKLDELKAKGRIRSAQGQQLLAQKLAFSSTLSLMGVSQED